MTPELRQYQIDVVERCREQIAGGKKRICLVAPTGAGKTIVAGSMIAGAVGKTKRVLFLAHTREIIGQTSAKLQAFGIPHGIIAADLTRGEYHDVQVASVQTFWSRVMRSKRIAPPAADVLFVDEAHHIRARTWREIIDVYPNAVLIGLTATPCRGDGRGLGEIFDVLVQCPQVPALIKLGYLVPTKTFAPAPPDLRGVRVQGGDYVTRQLGERMNVDALIGDIVVHWLRHANGLKTIIFAVDVAHSIHITREFVAAGVNCEHVDGSTPKPVRDAILRRLANGATTVVSNCAVLSEGVDAPNIACLILARPTKQLGLYRQMIGRGLRPAPGKNALTVLDHSGAIYAHGPVEDNIEWQLAPDARAINKNHDAKRKVRDLDGAFTSRLLDCKCCGAKRVSGNACVHCGHYPERPPKARVFHDGDLAPYDRIARTVSLVVDGETLLTFHAMLLHIAQSRGYKPGWASHKFKEKFGRWPPGQPKPMAPSAEVNAWVRSRTIAWSRGRGPVTRSDGGPPCPRCRRPMQVRERAKATAKQLKRWFCCVNRDCRTTMVAPERARRAS
jgi:DNA repair protein RadD